MSIHTVDVVQLLHTCPAEPEPHPYDIRRTVIDVIDGGPCRNPVTIRCGDIVTQIPCRRHEPTKRQCGACRIIVIERTITNLHPVGVAG
ncbi:hypothetical protein [Micromonospora sp. WMMC273]|uniref:hypothetical protein n=1 Tax=Micromonospora sp. WMMC273 TaxID=3015157 RepID=UPI0022B69E0B|nr:hypothetical protein [Micromonospora sp. WMMC273]MCZ7472757.1 hypothetical protein [Micromonospora sp. WMMC273]MCZ7478773.1 hypothetical protein [Micromonospora sp. WMMC273]MCZ7478796.1 hypothetical protein [Micromonospora sp. WMMC273]